VVQLGVDETTHFGLEHDPLEAVYLLDMDAAELSRVVLPGRKLSSTDEIRKLLAEVRTKRYSSTHMPCHPMSSLLRRGSHLLTVHVSYFVPRSVSPHPWPQQLCDAYALPPATGSFARQ